jgi:hypothetical protein
MRPPSRVRIALLVTAGFAVVSLAQDSATDPMLELRIVDRAGSPVSAAKVELLRHPPDETATASISARADAGGLARLPLPEGTFLARVSAAGFVERLSGMLTVTGPGSPMVLSLYPGAPVEGRVIDARGNPIEGARVCVELKRAERLPPEALGETGLAEDDLCLETDPEGRVATANLPHGEYTVRVSAPDRTSIEEVLRLDAGTRPGEWRLRTGGRIEGRLQRPDEQPVADAVLRLTQLERDATAGGTTGEDGTFRVAGLVAGHWRLRIEPREAAAIVRDGIVVREGGTTTLGTLYTRPGLEIEGRIVDTAGDPVAEAEISVREAEGVPRQLRLTRSADDGGFVASGLPDRPVNLLIDGPEGYASAVVEKAVPPERGLRVELVPSGTVCGTVLTDAGDVPAGATLSAFPRVEGLLKNHDELVRARTRDVDPASGRFCIEDTYPAAEVEVRASAAGFQSAGATVSVDPGEESGPVELVLERGLRLSGAVVDSSGVGVREVSIYPKAGTMVFSDDRGEFFLDGLRAGMNRVLADHPDYAAARTDVMLPLPTDERFTIVLEEGGTIEGSVTHHDGRPAAGIAVTLAEPSKRRLTDEEGKFRFEHVPSGSRKLSRRGGGRYNDFEHREVPVADGETVRVDFELGVVLEGRLLRGGAPVSGVAIALAQPHDPAEFAGGDHAVRRTFSDEQGGYRLAGVRPGWGTLTVEEPRHITVRPIEIPAGEEPRMDLHLPDRLLVGKVIGSRDEQGLGNAYVTANLSDVPGAPEASSSSSHSSSDSDGFGIRYNLKTAHEVRTNADADGNFDLFVEDAPEVSVGAWSPGYRWTSEMVDPSETVVLRLTRQVRVAVVLKDAQRRPALNSRVCFIRIEGESRSTQCSLGGPDRVEQTVNEGSFTILASAAGFATRVVERRLEAREDDGTEEIPIVLVPGSPLRIRLVGTAGEDARVTALIDPAGQDRGGLLVEDGGVDPATGDRSWSTWPLEPGSWTVSLDTGFGDTLQKTVEVVAGGEIEVSFP